MKTISNWDDLRPHGIIALTGEACGLGYRLLCDLTERGQRLIEKALGCGLNPAGNWNCGSETDPHVGSVMLARELLPVLGVFALLDSGCIEVLLTSDGTVYGIERDDHGGDLESFVNFHSHHLRRRLAYRGTAGDRNVHQMSGRVA